MRPADRSKDEKPCATCDLSDFDENSCDVEGMDAEAEYMKKLSEKLKTRRTQYDTVRAAYATARQDVAADLKQIEQQLKRIKEQLVCQLGEDERECLTEAWHTVRDRLEDCGHAGGCCVDEHDCTFEWTPAVPPSAPQIMATIEDFDGRVARAEACFDDVLAKEPDNLKKRVAELKTDVAQLATDTGATEGADYRRLYARYLWAKHRFHGIWLGFDTVTAFVDCLCLALNCSLQGRRAIARLTGALATLNCVERQRKARCDALVKNVWQEIVAECDRQCPPESSSKGSSPSAP
jgi:hypothetical protein